MHRSLSPTITSPAMLTGAGIVLGTAAYMAPEQAKGREADKRSDIWAFGCVLFEMLTGRRPFDGEDMTDVLGAVVPPRATLGRTPVRCPRARADTPAPMPGQGPRRRVGDVAAVRFVLDHHASLAPAAPVASRSNSRRMAGRCAGNDRVDRHGRRRTANVAIRRASVRPGPVHHRAA